MSEGALDRPTFEAIECYVLERMTADERAAFEQRLTTDRALRDEVDLERENIQAVELGGLSRALKSIAAEERMEERGTTTWRTILGYAAMIAAIVSGAIWWMTRTPLNEQLYAEHFTPDPGLPVAMGAADDPAFADAMVAYKLGEHAESRAKWASLLAKEPTNDTLRYYIASSWLAENNTGQAVPMLEILATEPGTVFHARARWYLFLAYVHDGRTAEAKALNMGNDPTYGDRARSIQTRLSD